jgi:hypothetical protein
MFYCPEPTLWIAESGGRRIRFHSEEETLAEKARRFSREEGQLDKLADICSDMTHRVDLPVLVPFTITPTITSGPMAGHSLVINR